MDFTQLSQLPSAIGQIWHYEMLSIDENEIAVGNVITALTILFFTLRLSRNISRAVAGILENKYKCDDYTVRSAQKSTFYFINIFAVILAMQIAHLPVSSFAFIGGSLAIAVGLGAQNFISNLVSGIFIVLERPMKVGDMIEVNGKRGKVHTINARCTILETAQKSKMLLPNSIIMQNTLINWTLEHNILKDSIHVKIICNETQNLSSLCKLLDMTFQNAPEHLPIEYFIEKVEESNVTFIVQFHYTQQDESSFLKAKHDIITSLDAALQNTSYQVT